MEQNSKKNQEPIQESDDRLKNFIERLERLSDEKYISSA